MWLAIVDWSAVVEALDTGRLACPPARGQVLRVAASIAVGMPVDLDACLSALDHPDVGLVVDALQRASSRLSGGEPQ